MGRLICFKNTSVIISKMNISFKILALTFCLHLTVCSVESYKAAYVREDVTIDNYVPLIHEASKLEADILVLPSPEAPCSGNQLDICNADKNDEIVKSISDASKKGKLYVVAHLLEKIRCQGQQEIIRNNLVFDREGSIVAVYRKPLQNSAYCNLTNTVASTFSTDFGATFGLLMEEDLVLKKTKDLKGVQNFVLSGKSSSNIPFLSASDFSSGWTYATKANLIWSKGVFVRTAASNLESAKVMVTEVAVNNVDDQTTIKFDGPSKLTNFPGEDLSQYTIRPLDIQASAHGYHETVCHNTFCCDFYLKTKIIGKPKEVNYGLIVFSGVQSFDHKSSIGVQSCALLACAGLYKRSCFLSSENTTNIVFEELLISGNFTKNSAQFPLMHSTAEATIEAKNFNMNEYSNDNQKRVDVKLYNAKDVVRFGIFGRDYSKDFESRTSEEQSKTQYFEAFDYNFSENMEELFDYLWIRLRVVIFIVSIYILEMM